MEKQKGNPAVIILSIILIIVLGVIIFLFISDNKYFDNNNQTKDQINNENDKSIEQSTKLYIQRSNDRDNIYLYGDIYASKEKNNNDDQLGVYNCVSEDCEEDELVAFENNVNDNGNYILIKDNKYIVYNFIDKSKHEIKINFDKYKNIMFARQYFIVEDSNREIQLLNWDGDIVKIFTSLTGTDHFEELSSGYILKPEFNFLLGEYNEGVYVSIESNPGCYGQSQPEDPDDCKTRSYFYNVETRKTLHCENDTCQELVE